MIHELIRTHPNFKVKLVSLYMPQYPHKFGLWEFCSFNHYVSFVSKKVQFSYWQLSFLNAYAFSVFHSVSLNLQYKLQWYNHRSFCQKHYFLKSQVHFKFKFFLKKNVANFFPKMNKVVENPFDDHSRSLHIQLVHKNHSIAQLNFISARILSFNSRKKHLNDTTTISVEINKALPKLVPLSSQLLSFLMFNLQILFPSSSYVEQTVNPNIVLPLSSALLTNSSQKY